MLYFKPARRYSYVCISCCDFKVTVSRDDMICRNCTDSRWKGPWAYYDKRDGKQPDDYVPTRAQAKPQRVYSWLSNPEPLIRQYEAAQGRTERWQAHKPLTEATITENRLGVGVLPASHCHHPRLIVPIFDGTLCVGLRGRWAGCACDPKADKWLVAGGTTLKNLPLYGSDKLRPGCVVWLVENCVDARLITQETDFVGCAMYSTAYWRGEWADTLKKYSPEIVVVALDNDLPGNGGAWRRQEFIKLWQAGKPGVKIPEASGIKRVESLLAAGLNATLYDWKNSPHKADIGSMFEKGV